MNTLPITRDLRLAYLVSLVIAVLMIIVSIAGLVLGSAELYGVEPKLVQVSEGGDAANLVVGLPILLGSLWLARRGHLSGLLLWPGALFYVLYTYALYLVGAPFSALFLAYVGLVTLSAYTTIGILASIDGEAVRQQLSSAPTRIIGGALVGLAVLAYAALTSLVIATLASPSSGDPLLRPQWIVDYTLGTPVLLIGGVLLWRRARLGYVSAAGLLLVSGVNGVAFAVSGALGALITTTPTDAAVIAVHLVISAISFALLVLFLRGAETLLYIASHRSLYILKQILWLSPSVLAMVVFLALYPALKHVNKSYAAIGAVLGISAWALSLAWPTTGEGAPTLVYLSDRYVAAATDAERTAFATAAEVLIATEAIPAAIGVLQTIGILVISLVMVRGGFPKSVAYLGVATGAIGIVSEALISILGIAYAIYGVLVMLWFLVIGWQLYRLGRD
ncbi:MAG TPA: hypothetical protein VFO07_09880 [Roseiflexaceae bacterium]|nr:hypothetical protein [Roseiflexaceae bacterium]